jgi:phosphoribosylformimino-5-aminoimidazole carboxamide ribonucleotide (ProFAR) isomerase
MSMPAHDITAVRMRPPRRYTPRMSNAQFTLLAGVEIANGQVEVLNHGEADDRTGFGDPVTAAKTWLGQGAQWIHLADLDAAAGRGNNTELIDEVVATCRGKAHVELAGGVRDDASLNRALDAGCARVVIDTAALSDLAWVKAAIASHDRRVGVAITAHRDELYAPGSAAHGADLVSVLDELKSARCANYIVTDVDSKGVRKKSQRHVLDAVLAQVHGHVVCCGGVSYLQDLHALTELVPSGLDAVVVDRALYTEAFSFNEATAALEPRYDLYHWGPPQ